MMSLMILKKLRIKRIEQLSMKNKEAIIILGGGLANDHGQWRTTGFDEGESFGAMGDRLRVEAAYILYKKNPELLIISSGSQGQYKNIPDVPTLAEVIKRELMDLGVPERLISKEDQSANTLQQLQALKTVINEKNLTNLFIISNQYHLPRLRAMIEKDDYLQSMLKKEEIKLISAEEVLIDHNPVKWQEFISKAYQSKAMKNRIIMEKKGVQQIKDGTYKLE